MAIAEKRKIGVINAADKKFILDNAKVLSVEAIAAHIHRHTRAVQNFIDKQPKAPTTEMVDLDTTKTNLHGQLWNREYWGEVKKQLTDDELKYFEAVWIELMLQFREDVLYAEELEIKQYITLDILINRNLIERKRAAQDVERLQVSLDKEYEKSKDDRDLALIANLESQLSFVRASIPAYAAEYVKLLDKRQVVSKDLKATRDQRIKRIEDSKSSWAGFLRSLEDEEERERVGDDAELMKLAKDKAKANLSQYHTYIDGTIDRPLLTADSIKEE